MDPIRIAVYENGLHPQAKLLYSILHAYADADGVAMVEESHIADVMRISPARLRGYRSMLNGSGYCSVALSGTSLIFRMASDHQVITLPIPDVPPAPISDHPTRDIARGARADVEPDAAETESDHPTRDSDHLARDIARGARAGGDNRGERERDLTPLPGKNSLTHSLPDGERKMSVALLTDPAVGMSRFSAERLAAKYPFEDIRAFACRWADEGRKPADEAGLIAYRLDAAETVPPLSRNELWQRHRTPEELAAEEQERAESERLLGQWRGGKRHEDEHEDDLRAPGPGAVPAPNRERPETAADLWTAVLADLALSLPGPTYKTWLRDTSALGYEDGKFVVGVSHARARDFLNIRLRSTCVRSLSRLAGRAVTVEFVVRDREAA